MVVKGQYRAFARSGLCRPCYESRSPRGHIPNACHGGKTRTLLPINRAHSREDAHTEWPHLDLLDLVDETTTGHGSEPTLGLHTAGGGLESSVADSPALQLPVNDTHSSHNSTNKRRALQTAYHSAVCAAVFSIQDYCYPHGTIPTCTGQNAETEAWRLKKVAIRFRKRRLNL